AAILPLFAGRLTGEQIVDRIRSERPREEVVRRMARVAGDLRQAGALTEPPVALDRRRGLAKFMRKEHLYRFPLTRRLGDLLEPFVAPARRVPGRSLVIVWLALAAVGMVLGVAGLTSGRAWV